MENWQMLCHSFVYKSPQIWMCLSNWIKIIACSLLLKWQPPFPFTRISLCKHFNECVVSPHGWSRPPPPQTMLCGCLTTAAVVLECLLLNVTHISTWMCCTAIVYQAAGITLLFVYLCFLMLRVFLCTSKTINNGSVSHTNYVGYKHTVQHHI